MVPQNKISPKSVLIVDPSDDARHVLRTVLERRGVQIWEASEGSAGLQLARDVRPDVIVLDAEGEVAAEAVCQAFAVQAGKDATSLILLGGARRRRDKPSAGSERVAKPYQYGPLIHRIEELLTQATQARRRCA